MHSKLKLVNDDYEQAYNLKLSKLSFFISTLDFINNEAHQPSSYPNLQISLSVVGLLGGSKRFVFNYFFLEREKGRKKEKNTDVREQHRLIASCMHPDRGMEPTT